MEEVPISSVQVYRQSGWEDEGNLPAPRWQATSVVFDGAIVVAGGRLIDTGDIGPTSGAVYTDTVLRFTVSDGWVSAAPLNSPRSWHSAAVLDDYLYVAGGFSSGTNRMDSVERYNGLSWQVVNPLPAARSSFFLQPLNGTLVGAGGYMDSVGTVDSGLSFDGTDWTSGTSLPARNAMMTSTKVPHGFFD